jgi:hypothetical protein
MPIIKPEYATDPEGLCNWARIDDPEDRELFLGFARKAEELGGAAALYEKRIVDDIKGDDVMTGGVTFHARPLSRLFKPGMEIYPYVATCGLRMYEYGAALTDPIERYWWDTIMQGAVGHARTALFDEVERIAGYKPISASPGSIELWPLNNQPALFSLVGDVETQIGVTVTESFLMLPLKSVSGILFPGDGGFTHNCCICTREVCPGRRVPFDAALKAQLEGESLSA